MDSKNKLQQRLQQLLSKVKLSRLGQCPNPICEDAKFAFEFKDGVAEVFQTIDPCIFAFKFSSRDIEFGGYHLIAEDSIGTVTPEELGEGFLASLEQDWNMVNLAAKESLAGRLN